MTKTKSTKRALLMSALSLLLCVSMLIGSTFAWFTDSVVSGNNIIKSGNLDIELEYWNGAEWKDVKDASDILTNSLWEPGVTEVAYLKVANAGSLVLKYQLGINILNEIAGKNQANETFKLSDYIMFGVVEDVNGETGAYTKDDAGRAEAIADVTAAKKISAGYTKAATMNPNDELYLALVVYMPTDVNNVANHNGTDIPQIDLGINVYATQMNAESDSFGPDYDKDSAHFVSTGDELRSAIATVKDGGTVYVNEGTYEISSQINIDGKSINIIGLGDATVKLTSSGQKAFYIYGSKVEGNTGIDVNISNINIEGNNAKSDIWVRTWTDSTRGDVNLTLDNVTCTSVIADNNYSDETIVNINVKKSNIGKITLDASPFNGNGHVTYTNLTYDGASRVDSINIQNGAAQALNNITINGVNPTATGEQQTLKYISTAEELAALGGTQINGTYVLMADIDMSGYEMKPIQVKNNGALVFDGNGYEISDVMIVAAKANGMTGAGNEVAGLFDVTANASSDLTVNNLTMKNVSISCSGYAAAIVGYANSSTDNITLKNVDVIGATISSDSVSALVGYTVGPLSITDCDVSGLVLIGEEGRPEKVGALVGTANTTACIVTVNNCTNATSYNDYGRVINGATWKGVIGVTSADSLQKALDQATGETTIAFRTDINGDVKVTQKADVKITIDGNGNAFNGVMTVFGNGRKATTALTVKNVDFVAKNGASSCIVSPDRNVNNAYSYSSNVSVENCTFTDPDGSVNCAAIRHEDGGDSNWKIIDCVADNTMHSLIQTNNVELDGLTIQGCKVYSKNGINLNQCTKVSIIDCTIDVKGYAVRYGVEGATVNGIFEIKDSTLKSANDEGDAVIIFRGTMTGSTLTITNTTLTGNPEISGNANVVR